MIRWIDLVAEPMTDTAIAADKVAAYRATQYRIGGPEPFTLRIGTKSDALLQLYRKTGQDCGLFITAFNPFGQAQSAEANENPAGTDDAAAICTRQTIWITVN